RRLKEQMQAMRWLGARDLAAVFYTPTAPIVERRVLDVHKLHIIRSLRSRTELARAGTRERMTAHILIVGAGAIGARHLQGLARIPRPLRVDVVGPSAGARERAAVLLAEVGGLRGGGAHYHADLSAVAAPDLAIVATNARERAGVVAELTRLGVRRFLLEK